MPLTLIQFGLPFSATTFSQQAITEDLCEAWQLVTLFALAPDVANASNPMIEAAPIVLETENALVMSLLLGFIAVESQHYAIRLIRC